MAATNRAGIWFQDLTAIIERAFVGDPNTTVDSPGWLPVLATGDQREFDVLITRRQDHHTTRTAIECKDWNTAIDVQEVESFITKYRRCGVHRAIMVSRLGFSKGAREAAAESSIDCMTLAPAAPDDIRVAVDLRHRRVHFHGVYYSIRNAANVVEPYEPFTASGQPISKQDLADLATQNAPDPDEIELTTGAQNYRVEFPSAGGTYLIDATGKRWGTRHRAAIGITEQTDAVALVVSEETGAIAIAQDGKLTEHFASAEAVDRALKNIFARPSPVRPAGWIDAIRNLWSRAARHNARID